MELKSFWTGRSKPIPQHWHLAIYVSFAFPSAQSITTAAGPGLQLGEFVDVEVGGRTEEKEEEKEEGEKEEEGPLVEVEGPEANGRGERPIGVVDPDRMLRTEEGKRAEEEEEEAEEAEQREPDLQPQRARQFSGTTAVALPPGRAQELGSLNLEVQVRPRFPDGVILYAAGSDPSRHPKQTPPLMHSLELTNRTVQYSFALGGEHFEILQSREPIRLDEWTIIRVINDGKGRASLQVGSSRPSELFYTPSRLTIPLANIPSRIFLGGPDPARAKYMPKTTNFVGSIGRLMMNGQEMEVVTASTEAEGGQGHYRKAEKQESRLDQSENQCSREPCRNGGQCRLTRWGGFECHCVPGFAGHLCQLPSTDGICPGGRRWCHRGICSFRGRKGDQAQCLCPPGWEGDRCGSEIDLESAPKGIRLDGANSFLALPLGAGVEEGEQTPRVYSIELRLSPDPDRRGHEQQQLVGLMVGAQGRVISALGMQGEKFWAVQQETDDQPATKRFLTKRIKHKKTHRLRLEQGEQAGEMRLLVEGHPKGVLRGEPGPDGILVLGGMPPRGMELPRAMAADTLLEGVPPFAGCVEELRLNGRVLGMEELRRDGYSGAGLDSCEAGEPQQKMPRTTAKPREDTAALWTTTSPPPPPPTRPAPTTPLPIFMVSQDPILANQRGRETPMVGPIGVIDEKEEEEWRRRPPADALSPDQIPTQLHQSVRTTSVPAPPPFTTTERPPDPTTAVPAPPRPVFRHRPDSFVPPNFAAFPDSAELEGPFAGLCDAWTCGGHGTCEELNGTHVLCACRDYYVGQRCGEFRPIEYAAKFDGTAFVVFSSDEFPHLSSEREEMVEFKLRTRAKYGLIIWQGQQPNVEEPEPTADAFGAEDFLSIGLLDGYLSFSYELGGGAAQLLSEIPVDDGKTHTVRAVRRGRDGWLFVDNEQPVGGRSSGILAMLNVEGHIFVGGVPDLHQMTSGLHTQNLVGCVAELALNGHKMDLMGSAIDGRNVRPCRSWEPNRMRRRRKWMRLMRKQRKTAQQRRRKKALAGE